jgi:hypothetical protein
LRYYILVPTKAREAIKQMPERFRKIMRADPTWRLGRDGTNIAETEAFLNERDKIGRENIRQDMFNTVFGGDAGAYYDGYYGKASGLVHGYETVLRDVHRELFNGVENPKIDYTGIVWDPNDAAAVLIHTLLDGLKVLTNMAGDTTTFSSLDRRFDDLQRRLGMFVPEPS